MPKISNEFIYFDPEFKGQHGDFTDNSVFTPEQRFEFLQRYSDFLKKSYSLEKDYEYAVPFSLSQEKIKEFEAKDNQFKFMTAYRADMQSEYKNWNLYTKKAFINDNCLVLANANTPPNPCAEYLLKAGDNLKELKFEFFMDGTYKADIHGALRETVTARSFEIKSGNYELLKLAFYSNGECGARCYGSNPYHSKFIRVGSFDFDATNTVSIVLHDNLCDITLNGQTTTDIALNYNLKPEILFFSSGMFHFGDWKIKPLNIKYHNSEENLFFEKAKKSEYKRELIGEVSVPYAIGCCENANKALILEKEFSLSTTTNAKLEFETLDPGGEVLIDGELVYTTDGFDSFTVDISKLDKHAKHILTVIVYPRAPEVLYNWHRQRDSYVGWFCGEILLNCYNSVKISDLKVVTKDIFDNCINASFSGFVNEKCNIKIFANQINSDEELFIAEFDAFEYFEITAKFNAKEWGIDNPNLYEITFTAYQNNSIVAVSSIETGFRTIKQANGEIQLNGKRIDLKGALLMQFLPPYNKTSQKHICPTDEEVLWQLMMLKAMGGNTLRIHILGYGTNDVRYARYADRLGILLIWTTRYIDSIEGVQWQGEWRAQKEYLNQVNARINHPSIIMWEGSNELHPNIQQINYACDRFVPAIKSVDTSRLICPVSHLYYAGEIYPVKNCEYISNDGKTDHNGNIINSSPYWTDELVVRSAHTYQDLCGYGAGWDRLRIQPWKEQDVLLNDPQRAYLVSEYAVIGRQNPNTPEAKNDYFNTFSYEFPDENLLQIDSLSENWHLSQAYQALCAHNTTKRMRIANADGLLWCCLMGGANDGGYLKPLIDNYGYAKLGFYTMRNALQDVCCFIDGVDLKIGGLFTVCPVFFGEKGKNYKVILNITDDKGVILESKTYENIVCDKHITYLPVYTPEKQSKGYYGITFEIIEA